MASSNSCARVLGAGKPASLVSRTIGRVHMRSIGADNANRQRPLLLSVAVWQRQPGAGRSSGGEHQPGFIQALTTWRYRAAQPPLPQRISSQ